MATETLALDIKGMPDLIRMEDTLRSTGKEIKNVQTLLDDAFTKGDQAKVDKYTKELAELRAEQFKGREEAKKLRKEVRENIKAQQDSEKNLPKDSLIALRRRYRELTREVSRLSKEQLNSTFGKNMVAEAKKVKGEIDSIEQSIGNFRSNVGNYKSALAGIDFSRMFGPGGTSGGDVASGLTNITGELGGMASMLKGPWGLAVQGGVAALGAITAAVADFQREIEVVDQLISQTLGEEGEGWAADFKAIADTFNVDVADVIKATNALVKNTETTIPQALDAIEKGFLGGANASGDFLDQLREYPSALSGAKVEAEQLVSIMVQQTREGVWSDKGIDAIKESYIALRELTKTGQEALEAIDISKADYDKIISEKGYLGLLGEIQVRLRGLEEDSQAVGMVMADVFKGAGEDAGVFFTSQLDINAALDDMIDRSDKLTVRQEKQVEINRELNEEWQRFADLVAPNTGDLALAWDSFVTDVLSGLNNLIETIGRFFDYLDNIGGSDTPLITGFGSLTSPQIDQRYKDAGKELGESLGDGVKEGLKASDVEEAVEDILPKTRKGGGTKKGSTTKLGDIGGLASQAERNADFESDQLAKQDQKIIDERLRRDREAQEEELETAQFFIDAEKAAEEQALEDLVEANKKAQEEITEADEEANQARLDRLKEIEAEKRRIIESSIKAASDAVFEIWASIQDKQYKREIDQLESSYEARIKAAEGNADLQAELEEELATKTEEINKEAFEKDKLRMIAEVIAQGAQAGIQAVANTTLPFPLSLTAAAPIAALTATKIAVIAGQSYAEGGFTGSEGIPDPRYPGRRLVGGVHDGEFVVTKEAVPVFRDEISEIEAYQARNRRSFAEGGFADSAVDFNYMSENASATNKSLSLEDMFQVVKAGAAAGTELGSMKGTREGMKENELYKIRQQNAARNLRQ